MKYINWIERVEWMFILGLRKFLYFLDFYRGLKLLYLYVN